MQIGIKHIRTLDFRRFRPALRLVLGLAAAVIGVINMAAVILPWPDWDLLIGAWPGDMHHGLHKLSVVIGFFLVMLTYGLIRGKRAAWYTATILLLLSSFFHLLMGKMLLTIVSGSVLSLLVVFYGTFRARSDPPSIRRGYIALLSGLGIVTLYTIGGLFFLYDQFEPLIDHYGIEEFLFRLLTNAHLHLPHGTQAFIFGRALPLLCLSAILYGIATTLRPVAGALFTNEPEQRCACGLVHMYGRNSISYFDLGADKSYFFSTSQKSVISYVLEGKVAVVAGDPVGPQEEMLSAIEQFLTFCQEQDWTVTFWQASDLLVDLYRAAGLHLMKIGEDAIIDAQTFSLAGKAMANVRSSAKRAQKEGIRVIFSQGPIRDAGLLAQMEQISRTWLESKSGIEMGFSMSRFDLRGDKEQVYALAIDDTNKVHAFVTFVPIYARNGWGLDLMRRSTSSAPGTMELLLASSIEYLARRGAEIVSLGLAPHSNVNNHAGHTLLEMSIESLTRRFGNPDRNRSLFNFKKKFQPTWENRYLVYSNTLTLPRIGLALYRAHQHDILAHYIMQAAQKLANWVSRHERKCSHARYLTGSMHSSKQRAS